MAISTGMAILGGAVASSLIGGNAAESAAETQAGASRESAALQKAMFDKQMELQDPFRQAGLTGQNRLMELMGLGGNAGAEGYGKYSRDFGMQDFQQDPGYAFRLSEGQKSLDRSAAARGGLISGGALKAASRYGQEMGSQEYQNAFNRYQTNRTNQLQPLGNLQAVGQSAASNQGSAAGAYGTAGGNAITQGGQAIAAGQMGSANSLANAITGGVSAYGQQQNFNNWLSSQNQPAGYYPYGGSNLDVGNVS
jgi:hypothetical protein